MKTRGNAAGMKQKVESGAKSLGAASSKNAARMKTGREEQEPQRKRMKLQHEAAQTPSILSKSSHQNSRKNSSQHAHRPSSRPPTQSRGPRSSVPRSFTQQKLGPARNFHRSTPSISSHSRPSSKDPSDSTRATRSSGPAPNLQLPWGYKGGGDLLGQPPKVQERERKKLEKEVKAKRERQIEQSRKVSEAQQSAKDTVEEHPASDQMRGGTRENRGTENNKSEGTGADQVGRGKLEGSNGKALTEETILKEQGKENEAIGDQSRKRKREKEQEVPLESKGSSKPTTQVAKKYSSQRLETEAGVGIDVPVQVTSTEKAVGKESKGGKLKIVVKTVTVPFPVVAVSATPVQTPRSTPPPTIPPTQPSLPTSRLEKPSTLPTPPCRTADPLPTQSLSASSELGREAALPPPRQPITFEPAKSVHQVAGYNEPPPAPLPTIQPYTLPPIPNDQRLQKPKNKSLDSVVKPPKPKDRHPALDSKEGWVVAERDLKIRPNGRPPVWAVGRQELCESLDYFKSYQGGHYDRAERCFGYLLDGFPSANDRCEQNGKVIISHGGGNSHATTAGYVLHSSQEREGVRMRALQNCLDQKVPVILLAGNQYSFFPELRDMGKQEGGNEVRYAVLGAFFVTHIWAEGEPVVNDNLQETPKDEFFVRFKVRFEWVESQGTPWFTDVIGKECPAIPPPTCSVSQVVTCSICHKQHRAIYQEAITCYDESCSNFFRLPENRMVAPARLNYHSSILALSPDFTVIDSLLPQPVIPHTLQSLANSNTIRDYSRAAWRGFGCSECGRLSSRSEWLKLTCQECGAEVDATGSKINVRELQKMTRKEVRGRRQLARGEPLIRIDSIPQIPLKSVSGYEGFTYDLGNGSRVHHYWPSADAGSAKADRLFEGYQGEAAGKLFKRNPLSNHRAQGSLLCQQFTWNGGKEYLHAIGAETYPFEEVDDCPPLAPTNSLSRNTSEIPSLNYSTSLASTEDLPTPTKTSSPGSAADKSTRLAAPCAKEACEYLKQVVPLVVSEDNVKETGFNEILSVAYMEGGKMSFHDDGEHGLGPCVASISLGADAVMSFRRKEKRPRFAKKDKDSKEPVSKTCRIALRIKLSHGDICVMEGAEMQKLYEHAVEPEGLRFAATARVVGPDHIRKPKAGSTLARAQKSGHSNPESSLMNRTSIVESGATTPSKSRKPLRQSSKKQRTSSSPSSSLLLPDEEMRLDASHLLLDRPSSSDLYKALPCQEKYTAASTVPPLSPSNNATPELSSDLTSVDSSDDSSSPHSAIEQSSSSALLKGGLMEVEEVQQANFASVSPLVAEAELSIHAKVCASAGDHLAKIQQLKESQLRSMKFKKSSQVSGAPRRPLAPQSQAFSSSQVPHLYPSSYFAPSYPSSYPNSVQYHSYSQSSVPVSSYYPQYSHPTTGHHSFGGYSNTSFYNGRGATRW
ncbi:hypothetical protein JCM3765_002096 [Sporobolomyces pararoseus]